VLLKDYEVINKAQFYALYPADKYISPKTRAFIDFFAKKLG
jgi:DNA-binding transcriptional LysR family regulator